MSNKLNLKIKGWIGVCISFCLLIIKILFPIVFDNSLYQLILDIIIILIIIISMSYFGLYVFKSTSPKEYERFKKYK